MTRPNTDRNRELVEKRIKDPKKWSYAELGKFYKLHRSTVVEIFKREQGRILDTAK